MGDRQGEAKASGNLGNTLKVLGRYDEAIVCCENLLASSDSVRYMLSGVRVCIAPYFAVMSDGEMYIMWDWVSDG